MKLYGLRRFVHAAVAITFASCLLAADAKLSIVKESVQMIEDGPSLGPGESYVAGETVYFSCQIAGFQVSQKEKIALEWDIAVRDAAGLALVPPYAGKVEADILQEDKKWMPKARHNFLIPPHAPAGEYKIIFHAKDTHSGSEITKELTFPVRGPKVEPSETFVVRNLRFFRAEEDRQALRVVAYRPGDTVFARFDIVGYKLGPENAFDVDYGIEILKETGESLFAQPSAAGEKDQTFYPRRWVPGVMNLPIPKDLAKATYVLVIKANDKVGNQAAETRANFTVE